MNAFSFPITSTELNATGGIVMKSVNPSPSPAPTGYPSAFANAIVIETFLNVTDSYQKFNNDFLQPRIVAEYNQSGEYNSKLIYDTPEKVTKTRTTVSRPRQLYILNTSGVILDYLVLASPLEEQDFIANPTRYLATSIAVSQAITIMPFQACYRLLIKKNGGSATTTVNINLTNYIIVEQ